MSEGKATKDTERTEPTAEGAVLTQQDRREGGESDPAQGGALGKQAACKAAADRLEAEKTCRGSQDTEQTRGQQTEESESCRRVLAPCFVTV